MNTVQVLLFSFVSIAMLMAIVEGGPVNSADTVASYWQARAQSVHDQTGETKVKAQAFGPDIELCDFLSSDPITQLSCATASPKQTCTKPYHCASGRCCLAIDCAANTGVCKPLTYTDVEVENYVKNDVLTDKVRPITDYIYQQVRSFSQNKQQELQAKVQRRCNGLRLCGRSHRCSSDEDCYGTNDICCPGNCGAGTCVNSKLIEAEKNVARVTAVAAAQRMKDKLAYVQGNTPDICGPEYKVPSCSAGYLRCANDAHCYGAKCCRADCGLGVCTELPKVLQQLTE